MLRRLFLGLVLGVVLGGLVAGAIVSGLKLLTFAAAGGALMAYAAALATGALTGLVAGKPIWAPGAKVEAGLKAFFGALLAAGGMFALRQWAPAWTVDLSPIHAGGPAPLGELPAASLPLIGAVLGGLFELDNTGDASVGAPGAGGGRIAARSGPVRVGKVPPSADDAEDDEASAPPGRAGR
jgi:hypothetical protein